MFILSPFVPDYICFTWWNGAVLPMLEAAIALVGGPTNGRLCTVSYASYQSWPTRARAAAKDWSGGSCSAHLKVDKLSVALQTLWIVQWRFVCSVLVLIFLTATHIRIFHMNKVNLTKQAPIFTNELNINGQRLHQTSAIG